MSIVKTIRKETMSSEIGRWAELNNEVEISTLSKGMDFRLPIYRREVFLRFFKFHLIHRSSPGAVYYAFPFIEKHEALDKEQLLWIGFLNGNSQNICTTLIIFRRFLRLTETQNISEWFSENYSRLEFDTDRRYQKKDFLKSVECYRNITEGNQEAYFDQFQGDEHEVFRQTWKAVRRDFFTMGRLSTYSYMEFLRILGQKHDCSELFLDDMSGSKSHRNGLAKVLGRDDLDWHVSTGFEGKYFPGQIEWLKSEGELLLNEAKQRFKNDQRIDPRHISYFSLESAFCTYKSWHRPRRRYPNVYNDLFYGRIKRAEERWGKEETKIFWEMREECIPDYLRLECCPNDPGLVPEKQDHYRLTGEVIMMSREWPEFDNEFDRKCWEGDV